jgi:hypothetical protein
MDMLKNLKFKSDFLHSKMINPICEYIVSDLMWEVDGKGLAPFQISPRIKI